MLSGFTDERARRLRRARRNRLRGWWRGARKIAVAVRETVTRRGFSSRGNGPHHDPGTEGAGRPAPVTPSPPSLSGAAVVSLPPDPDDPIDVRLDGRRRRSR